jgi:hypothetical protein
MWKIGNCECTCLPTVSVQTKAYWNITLCYNVVGTSGCESPKIRQKYKDKCDFGALEIRSWKRVRNSSAESVCLWELENTERLYTKYDFGDIYWSLSAYSSFCWNWTTITDTNLYTSLEHNLLSIFIGIKAKVFQTEAAEENKTHSLYILRKTYDFTHD